MPPAPMPPAPPPTGCRPSSRCAAGPRTAVSAAVARTLFRAAVRRLAVTVVEEPSGLTFGQGGPVMRVHRPDEFYARVGRDGLIGFGESYLTGAWDADDVAGFLTVPAARIATLVPGSLQKLRALVTHRTPSHQVGTEDNSQANISHHYDLSNDLFALFLDETLSYSSALFDTSARRDARPRGRHRPLPGRGPAGGPRRPPDRARVPTTSPTRRPARSTGSSTRPASPRAPGSWRSAPAGASWRSAPPAAARPCTRSPCRWSSSSSPSSGSPRPVSPTGCGSS